VKLIESQSICNVGPFPPESYVTADDIAAHLKITRRQVLEMTRRGLIPAHPLGIGKSRHVWRYKISEVESGIASGIRNPIANYNNNGLARGSSDGTMRPDSSPRLRRKSNG
jgi:hypothetical protein